MQADEQALMTGYMPSSEVLRDFVEWLKTHEPGDDVLRATIRLIWSFQFTEEPAVFYTQWHPCLHAFPRRNAARAFFLIVPYLRYDPEVLARWVDIHLRRHPDDRLVFLCWSEDYKEELRRRSLEAEYCHFHALIDDRIFRPDPTIIPSCDAVLSANTGPWKRHYLAAKIPKWGLVTYFFLHDDARSTADLQRILALPGCTLLQSPFETGPELVAASFRQAKIGLCFSALEPPSHALMEYLLCGLPVVHTDNFRHTELVPPEFRHCAASDPDAVAAGVAALAARGHDPWSVHNRTLAMARPQRAVFERLVNEALQWAGAERRLSLAAGVVVNKMLAPRDIMTFWDPVSAPHAVWWTYPPGGAAGASTAAAGNSAGEERSVQP